ncbi:MAG: V-type ATPase 116kDa subunit family protein, partial [Clostridiales bacterium]|nr:V-type ATPase 116kDa subunit family protein [Clostridiales bacterium]
KGMKETINKKKLKQVKVEANRKEKESLLRQIAPYRAITYDVSELLKFKVIKFHFGRIPRESYHQFEQYVYDNLNVIFYKCLVEEDYVWGIYFVPRKQANQVDAVLAALHFEKIHLPDSYDGTAEEAYARLKKECRQLAKKSARIQEEIKNCLQERSGELAAAKAALEQLSVNFDVRKLAACTKGAHATFYILCGWMTEKDAEAFQKEIEEDKKIYCFVEDAEKNVYSTPPTKLKNPWFAKPFEMFTRMYGLPGYHEMDPTTFVAITYAFIFGAMFGDLGQGLCLMLGGFLLYRFRKMNLAAIIGTAGIFSAFFGVMFGSFFGFENVFDAVWLRPKEAMSQLPFIGNLNTVFIVAIAFGMFLILVTMIFQMRNAWRNREMEHFLFDTNGLAGFVFYAALVLVIVLYMSGRPLPATGILVVMFVVPLLLLALKEPLTSCLEKHKPLISSGPVMFVVQTFFELFEVLLSYFSNTLSFVRIGAFAVSHAAMMEVVLMLAGAEKGGNINWIVVVLGNIFVCGLEGLIVGIQVLRLEY